MGDIVGVVGERRRGWVGMCRFESGVLCSVCGMALVERLGYYGCDRWKAVYLSVGWKHVWKHVGLPECNTAIIKTSGTDHRYHGTYLSRSSGHPLGCPNVY